MVRIEEYVGRVSGATVWSVLECSLSMRQALEADAVKWTEEEECPETVRSEAA